MEDDIINIKEFAIQKIEPSCSWLLLGPPNSGKSSLIEDIVKHNRYKYPVCRVNCSVPGPHKRYCQIFPPLYVHSEFDKDKETEFIDKRQKALANSEDMGRFCVYILDDIDINRKQFGEAFFSTLFKQGSRHFNLLTIVASQYALDFPPDIRSAASYIAIFRYTSKADRTKLYNNYATIFGSEKIFNAAMDKLTGDHHCIIIKQRSDSNALTDCVFWYKTQPQTDWKFGCKELWRYNKKKCDSKKKYGPF